MLTLVYLLACAPSPPVDGPSEPAWETVAPASDFQLLPVAEADLDGLELGLADTYLNPQRTGPVLRTSGTCPGTMTFLFRLAPRDADFLVLQSPTLGSRRLPTGPCRGLQTGLGGQPRSVGTLDGPRGYRTVDADVPASACGTYLQVLDRNSCRLSPVRQLL